MSLSVSVYLCLSLCVCFLFFYRIKPAFCDVHLMIMIIANNCVQYTDITTYLSLCVCVFVCLNNTSLCCGKFSLTTWHVLAEEGERGGGACECDGHSKDKHACLSRSFVLSNSNASTSFYFHTHTHTDVEQTKWASAKERKRSVCFVLSVCESVGDLSLSLTLFLRLHLPIMKCIQIHPRNQLVCLFCMFVTLSFSPFLLLILIQRFVQIAAKLLLCLSIFLILSQPAASTYKIQKKKEAKKKRRKTNTL